MKQFISALDKIIKNVLTALYQPFWAALLLAVIFMFLFLYAKEHHWTLDNFLSNMICAWYKEFRKSSMFRRVFLLMFYTTMILFRTVLNREIWFDPLGKIMEGWGIYDTDGTLTTEAIENFMLFVPFTILLFWAIGKRILGNKFSLKDVVWKSIKIVGVFALTIEFVQVLFHLGTFQLSDLCYNTLGGILGGVVYFGLNKKII